jgi:hypothetical protein
MTREQIAALWPHLDEAKLAKASEIAQAAQPLKEAFNAHPNEQMRQILLQQWSQLLQSAISTL